MSYCVYCGKKLEESYKFCPYCGAKKLDFENCNEEYKKENINKKHSIVDSVLSMAFGIASLYCAICVICPFVGLLMFLPLFIIFTIFSKKYKRQHLKKGNPQNRFIYIGEILSNIAIIIGSIFLALRLPIILIFIA